ncbi:MULTISPECIES: prepilin-type N-terminal cleavage/methylation domain-containing protein [Halorhodospira]|uniref:prepilin-type N-terminal cleavage/methylation domain-containing protein n=1 Tax=Halorhodospira TaxID=85108 RepID=UPI001EE9A213|nr:MULTISPECIES: prepilin-type N-terminal cleavage/methylation domain-containing protein [Halorhodospira]MCG5528638.1 prepilin-type N-terminal cleavage/methylation domain-containing protein [Halorhodospira halophila]MCG5543965.1 prepilin-type N-terminal cleavage/methylation domain-containing protein [Halorhodospira sp. 9628]
MKDTQTPLPKRLCSQRGTAGFTLLELVIVLALSSLLAVLIARPLASVFEVRTVFQDEVTTKEELNYALQRMSREVMVEASGPGKCPDYDEDILVGVGEEWRPDDLTCEEYQIEAPDRDGDIYLYELIFEFDAGENVKTVVGTRNY